MATEWTDAQPIYRQLRDMIVALILDGALTEGDALPSVRQVAAEYRVNPLTVLRSFQQLVDEDIVEKRRGLGMFVRKGATQAVLRAEREKFLSEDWPRVREKIERLGLDMEELLTRVEHGSHSKSKARR